MNRFLITLKISFNPTYRNQVQFAAKMTQRMITSFFSVSSKTDDNKPNTPKESNKDNDSDDYEAKNQKNDSGKKSDLKSQVKNGGTKKSPSPSKRIKSGKKSDVLKKSENKKNKSNVSEGKRKRTDSEKEIDSKSPIANVNAKSPSPSKKTESANKSDTPKDSDGKINKSDVSECKRKKISDSEKDIDSNNQVKNDSAKPLLKEKKSKPIRNGVISDDSSDNESISSDIGKSYQSNNEFINSNDLEQKNGKSNSNTSSESEDFEEVKMSVNEDASNALKIKGKKENKEALKNKKSKSSSKKDNKAQSSKQGVNHKKSKKQKSNDDNEKNSEEDTPKSKKLKKDDAIEDNEKSPSVKNINGEVHRKQEDSKSDLKENKKEDKANSKSTIDKKQSSESSYDPSKSKYHPIDNACWKMDQKVPYNALAKTFEAIEDISARLKIIEILSNYFRSVITLCPDDLLPSIYLCLNQLGPAYEGLELGIAETNLMKAICQCTGRSLAQIKAELKNVGDLGIVAENSRLNQRMMFQPPPLIVNNVYIKLKEIASTSGQLSNAKKIDKIQSLFVGCRGSEARYLIRSLAGKLRIGLAEQSVLQALALACTMTPPNQERPFKILNASEKKSTESFQELYKENALILKTTYCQCPNYDKIIPVLLSENLKELPKYCKLNPGIPLKPMLAHPTKGVQEVLNRLSGLNFTCEWKYDGERAQIHILEDGTVNIFSRNQENNTSKYPDIISRIKNTCSNNVKSCILDCEAVAWDNENKKILPFQILSTRKRKDADKSDIKVHVCVFMFDLLYFNGEPLVEKSLKIRRDLLRENFKVVEGEWQFATNKDVTSVEEIQEVLEESIKGSCEGLMIKSLDEDATYEIAKRSHKWLKLKKDYLDGVGDTLDLVVVGGYTGKGKRTGTYGGFLLACYDEENEEYQIICKIGTGFSEEDLTNHTANLKDCVIDSPKSYYRYDSSLTPDHWFEPKYVWEIKCADFSLSPVYTAAIGKVDPEKGISLRFPRFVRLRDDKKCEEATSASQIATMYSNQEQVKSSTATTNIAEEDMY